MGIKAVQIGPHVTVKYLDETNPLLHALVTVEAIAQSTPGRWAFLRDGEPVGTMRFRGDKQEMRAMIEAIKMADAEGMKLWREGMTPRIMSEKEPSA